LTFCRDSLRDLIKPQPGPNGTYTTIFNATALSDIDHALSHCDSIFTQIKDYLKRATKQVRRIAPNSTATKITLSRTEKAKWPFLQPQFQELRNDLRDSKSNLLLMVAVANLAVAQRRGDGVVVDDAEKKEMRATIVRLQRAGTMDVGSFSDEEVAEVGAVKRLFRRVVAWRIGRKQVESDDDDDDEEGRGGTRGLDTRSMAVPKRPVPQGRVPVVDRDQVAAPIPQPPEPPVAEIDHPNSQAADGGPSPTIEVRATPPPPPPLAAGIDLSNSQAADESPPQPPEVEAALPPPTAAGIEPIQPKLPQPSSLPPTLDGENTSSTPDPSSANEGPASSQVLVSSEEFPDIETVAGPSTAPKPIAINTTLENDAELADATLEADSWALWGLKNKRKGKGKGKAPIQNTAVVQMLDAAVQTSPIEGTQALDFAANNPPSQQHNNTPTPPQPNLTAGDSQPDKPDVDSSNDKNTKPISLTIDGILQAWTSTILPGLTDGNSYSLAIVELTIPPAQVQSLLPIHSQHPTSPSTMDILRNLNPYQRRMILDHVQARGAKLLHVDVWHKESVVTVFGQLDVVTLIWITSTTQEKLKAFETKGWGAAPKGGAGTGMFSGNAGSLFGGLGTKADNTIKDAEKKGKITQGTKSTIEHRKSDTQEKLSTPNTQTSQEPIKFKDAVGRKFSFPFHLVKSWKVCPCPQAPSLTYQC
jgi:hypothetical protein